MSRFLNRLRFLNLSKHDKLSGIEIADLKEKAKQARDAIISIRSRLDTLEAIVADHEERISALEG